MLKENLESGYIGLKLKLNPYFFGRFMAGDWQPWYQQNLMYPASAQASLQTAQQPYFFPVHYTNNMSANAYPTHFNFFLIMIGGTPVFCRRLSHLLPIFP